jgi:hypothetical protein
MEPTSAAVIGMWFLLLSLPVAGIGLSIYQVPVARETRKEATEPVVSFSERELAHFRFVRWAAQRDTQSAPSLPEDSRPEE